jgi:hypothetical protein
MRAFPGLYQIVEVKAPSQTVDLISFFVDDIEGVVVGGIGVVKINCVGLVVPTERRVVKLVPRVLAHGLRIGAIVLLVVAHAVDIVVRVGRIVLIALAGVLEFPDLKGLLDENILNVIGQVVDLILGLILLILLILRLSQKLGLPVFRLYLIKQTEL